MRSLKRAVWSALAVVALTLVSSCDEVVTQPEPRGSATGNTSAICGEAACVPVTGKYISHFTGANCTGTESYYTAYYYYDGIRRSWDGEGVVGTQLRTVTNRSWKMDDGGGDGTGCRVNAWPAGNTLSDFVTIYREVPPTDPDICGEVSCVPVTGKYISHFTGANCTGTESYYTAYYYYDGVRRSWDGKGIVGTQLRTVTNRSWKMDDGGGDGTGCRVNAWPEGNTLSDFVTIYRGEAPTYPDICGEAACVPVTGKYISHFTGANCTGTESYYTAYYYYDGIRRSWDGEGVVGTQLRTVTNRSWKMDDGGGDGTGCRVNAWPAGNTLSDFVTIYREGVEPPETGPCGEAHCTPITEAYISHFPNADCTGQESYYTGYNGYDGVRRSWDGGGVAGTVLRTLTHKSWKMNDGGGDGSGCRVNEWPAGNTLTGFVHIYR